VSWWHFARRRRPALVDADTQRLARWRALKATPPHLRLDQTRFVVLDTETSGLDLAKDRMLSIAAVTVQGGALEIGRAFERVLEQDAPSTEQNILIHGIGGSEQLAGVRPTTALLDFLDYAGNSPLVAFHAGFDRHFIDRALRHNLGCVSAGPWFDLALLMPALFRDHPGQQLDDWLLRFGIAPAQRHSALGDAAATAELLLIALAQAHARGIADLRALRKCVGQGRWLPQ
jgi:DNA polymerase-3 subunit epsilon